MSLEEDIHKVHVKNLLLILYISTLYYVVGTEHS